MRQYQSFREFYPFYLSEHSHRLCRRMHFIGSTLVLLALFAYGATGHWAWLALMPVFGYGFAWLGHFVFEKNRPATFRYPFYSLLGDWVMYSQMWRDRLPF